MWFLSTVYYMCCHCYGRKKIQSPIICPVLWNADVCVGFIILFTLSTMMICLLCLWPKCSYLVGIALYFSCSVLLSLSHFLHSLYDCFIFALNWLAFVWVDASGCCRLVPFAYDCVVGSSSHLPAEMLFLKESLMWSHVYSQELYRYWSSVVWQGMLLWNAWPKKWLPFLTPVPWIILRAWPVY